MQRLESLSRTRKFFKPSWPKQIFEMIKEKKYPAIEVASCISNTTKCIVKGATNPFHHHRLSFPSKAVVSFIYKLCRLQKEQHSLRSQGHNHSHHSISKYFGLKFVINVSMFWYIPQTDTLSLIASD